MSLKGAHVSVDDIAEADPASSDVYRANAAEIEAMRGPLRDAVAESPPRRRGLVTTEGAFGHLSRDFGFPQICIRPVDAAPQAMPQQVCRAIDAAREHDMDSPSTKDGPRRPIWTSCT